MSDNLVRTPAEWKQEWRSFVAALPWIAERNDPRRIRWADVVLIVLFLAVAWWITG